MRPFTIATIMLPFLALGAGAEDKDCGATGLGCKSEAEIAWVEKAATLFPYGTGLAHRAFGYYCARHPNEQATCLANPWAIVVKLKIDRSAFDQGQ